MSAILFEFFLIYGRFSKTATFPISIFFFQFRICGNFKSNGNTAIDETDTLQSKTRGGGADETTTTKRCNEVIIGAFILLHTTVA